MENMDQKIGKMGQKIEKIEQKMEQMEKRFLKEIAIMLEKK